MRARARVEAKSGSPGPQDVVGLDPEGVVERERVRSTRRASAHEMVSVRRSPRRRGGRTGLKRQRGDV